MAGGDGVMAGDKHSLFEGVRKDVLRINVNDADGKYVAVVP